MLTELLKELLQLIGGYFQPLIEAQAAKLHADAVYTLATADWYWANTGIVAVFCLIFMAALVFTAFLINR